MKVISQHFIKYVKPATPFRKKTKRTGNSVEALRRLRKKRIVYYPKKNKQHFLNCYSKRAKITVEMRG